MLLNCYFCCCRWFVGRCCVIVIAADGRSVAVWLLRLLLLFFFCSTRILIQQQHCMDGNRANANELSLAVAIGLTRTAQVRIPGSTSVNEALQ